MTNRIGRYKIQAELGRGGFGQVFRAYDPTVGRLVAIKTLTASGDPELLKRFRNEAAAAGKLRHNNIVVIYDFGEHDGSPFLVMELLDGEDLDHIISARRQLTLLETLDIIGQSAAGLHHAHERGIVHRDIKPANIMLQRDGIVKITDFGIALLTQATAARLTPQGSLIGTFPYMAPEQFHGTASDALTDIFAFGVTCYKLLTGVHPFHAAEMGGLMYNIMNQAPAPIRSLRPECPEALEQAIFKTLEKDRAARYQSLEDVRFDLEPVIVELRKERVADLISEARSLIAASQLDAASARVREAIEADPGNRTVRELRETLQKQIREHELRPHIASLVNQGQEDLEARRFEAALQKFHSALELDKSNPELHALLAQAREAKQRAEQAGNLLARAQRCAELGDLTAARVAVEEALAADPNNVKAEELRAQMQARILAREKERRRQEGLGQARRLMVVESFDQAIEQLESLAREHSESTAVRELLARARTEQEEQSRRRRLQMAADQAKALLKAGSYAEGVKFLGEWRSEFPDSTELRDLALFAAEELRVAQQEEAVARAASETRILLKAGKFDEAVDLVRRALAESPGAPALRELMQTVVAAQSNNVRRAALEETLRQARSLNGEQRFREALETIEAYVKAYGESDEIEPLRSKAEEGLENQRRLNAIRKLAGDARAMLDEGRADSATQALEMATMQFPDDSELLHLFGEAQQQLVEKQRADAISRIITEAESLARARNFDRALSLLNQGLQEHPGAERLLRCREATLAGTARFLREQALRKLLEEAREMCQAGELHAAIAKLDGGLREFGNDPALAELKQQIDSKLAVQEQAADVRPIAGKAQEGIPATELLRAVQQRVPSESTPLELEKPAEATRLFESGQTGRKYPWKWIGGGAAVATTAVIAGVTLWPHRATKVVEPPVPTTFPVEIRTDPPHADVSLEGRSCKPPDCRFDLPPREYTVVARLDGYQPVESVIRVESAAVPGVLTLTLDPEPPPTLPVGSGRGTLMLRGGVAGARVVIDGVPYGLTNSAGEFRTMLGAGAHDVRVEKAGYLSPADQRAAISNNEVRALIFRLTPLPAKLEIRGAPAGVEISIGPGAPRRSEGAPVLVMDIEPGHQTVSVVDGRAEQQIARRFEPGGTVTMTWEDIAPPKAQTAPKAAPTLTAEAREAQDWERIRDSSDPERFENFIRQYPGGSRIREAEARVDDARWALTNQSDVRALQSYVSRFPRGSHLGDAQRLLDDASWNALNKSNASAVEAFINSEPNSRHRQEAQALLDRLNRERQQMEEARKKVETAVARDRQAIRNALQRFNDAFVHKSPRELQQIWPGALKDWLDSLNQRGAYFVATLYPMGEPEISGNVATIPCDLITQTIIRGQPQRQNRKSVKVTLRRSGQEWLLEDPRGAQ